ncbi:alfa-L-rhamnosidase [Echinicola pacifica]|uniref:alpha-L-rhamnosidase n=1 Tax=Echinicola pacifica TaxID=346377 RepID=A0A918PWL5_9BACT|nr:family 78 glycoside hydrolase catalytic domain [Echinicola pacifica]GGZ25377.1 alfa-L-rhamnosidase [Echinicola pacifica]
MNVLKHYFPLSLLLIAALCLGCAKESQVDKPFDLEVSEGFKNPIGFYDAKPTFSWKLPVEDEVKRQSAYQIVAASSPDLLPEEADLWNSDKQSGSQSAWVDYNGSALSSRQKVYWQVRYWDQAESASAWSEVNSFELGLLENADWNAKWVGLPTAEEKLMGSKNTLIHRPQYLRKSFETDTDIASARLYITAKGVFDVWINGKNVSDDVMPPGWTPYDTRIETITYEVTELISQGQNTIGVELAEGWHSGRIGYSRPQWSDKVSPKILCQLEITHKDGTKETIVSDQSWKGTTNGPIRISEIYDGETYDANFELPNWTKNDFDDQQWQAVNTEDLDPKVKLEPKRHYTVKSHQTLATKGIMPSETGTIFDLAQNMVGVPLIKAPVKKGDTLTIRFSEMLSPDGGFYTDNYRSALSTDYYIASEEGLIDWSPKFTFHGFRYVELSGYDASKEPDADWVSGLVQYSGFEGNGTFSSSHDKLNQLQSNIVWGLRGNFFDVPTDCPQRDERLGWTGDAQVFGPTSLFNADVYSFWANWLQSVREEQFDNGGIPFVVPDIVNNQMVSSGWGDACTIIPWKLYFYTGDKRILEENYEMMKKWLVYHESTSEGYISHMNSFADWLQPFPKNGETKGDTSHDLIGTAFFAYSAKLTAQAAEVLGKTEDHKKYQELYKKVSQAFDSKFFDENGQLKEVASTQTSYLLALAFDLLPASKKQKSEQFLIQEIEAADNHLGTGFLGTPLLSEVLGNIGMEDLMYQLLFNETYPSWFYSINQGATTIWERWNSYSKEEGFNPQQMNSLNHYAYGAVGQWMYERIAGISPMEAGYKKIKIAPYPQAPLSSAEASLDTPYGKVTSSWEINGNEFHLTTTIPPNTSAEVHIPAQYTTEVLEHGKSLNDNANISMVKSGQGFLLLVQPGTYTFSGKAK